MNMIPVSSSNIASIGYEAETLYVKFNAGSIYAYNKVPESIYNSLMASPSKGTFLTERIKGVYSFKRIA